MGLGFSLTAWNVLQRTLASSGGEQEQHQKPCRRLTDMAMTSVVSMSSGRADWFRTLQDSRWARGVKSRFVSLVSSSNRILVDSQISLTSLSLSLSLSILYFGALTKLGS